MKIKNNINWDLFENIEDAAKNEILDEVCEDLLTESKQKVPVRTGKLLSHTRFTNTDGRAQFISDVDYAADVYKAHEWFDNIDKASLEAVLSERIGELLD